MQRARSFRSTSASAAGGPAGVRKMSRSFDRKRMETMASVSCANMPTLLLLLLPYVATG
jgi:hypothetical protein